MDAIENNSDNLTAVTIPSKEEDGHVAVKKSKKLKIDKRNLIIYSEIMRPKFKE